MQFILHDYIANLREREELDAILPDLLRAMGYQIVKLAFRGEVEHGVDIAAVRKQNGSWILSLFQIKRGDIDQNNWDIGPNSVRTTLNNLLDVPFEDLTQRRLREAKREVILVHNGILRQNIKDRFDGYLQREFLSAMEYDRWDLDRLVHYAQQYLFNERILPSAEEQQLLKRTLMFIDVPDYDLVDFKKLVQSILVDTVRLHKAQRNRVFGVLRLVLAMVLHRCKEPTVNNLSPALLAHENAVLALWGWMYRNSLWERAVAEEFTQTFIRYLEVLREWIRKIAPALLVQDGLSLNASSELVEYPLRTFEVIGHLGLLVAVLYSGEQSESTAEGATQFAQLLVQTIHNNNSRHRPLLDNHAIDIFMGMHGLILAGYHEVARSWLKDLLEHLLIRWNVHKRLPELRNDIDLVIEYEATGQRPIGYTDSSSTLLYMLFELCLLFGEDELYSQYVSAFQDVGYQVWYPPSDVEKILYSQEVFGGATEVISELPEDLEKFWLDVQARHQQFDSLDFSPFERNFPVMLLIASRHFRTPVFPIWWRSLMVLFGVIKGKDTDESGEEE